ncbi:MAG: tripartite tricarboxylate transporter TctB family protein [Pseudomonadota bacterium]
MLTLTKDRALALAMLLITGIMLVETRNIPEPTSWQPYGSALFPRILLAVVALLSLLILVRTFFGSSNRSPAPRHAWREWVIQNRSILALFGAFGLYAALLPIIGYIAATLTFLLASLALLMGVDTKRKWLINLAVSVTLTFSVYVIFRFGLNVWLP